MDQADFTHDATGIHQAFPHVPDTSLSTCLVRAEDAR
jgi:hypothetical protein